MSTKISHWLSPVRPAFREENDTLRWNYQGATTHVGFWPKPFFKVEVPVLFPLDEAVENQFEEEEEKIDWKRFLEEGGDPEDLEEAPAVADRRVEYLDLRLGNFLSALRFPRERKERKRQAKMARIQEVVPLGGPSAFMEHYWWEAPVRNGRVEGDMIRQARSWFRRLPLSLQRMWYQELGWLRRTPEYYPKLEHRLSNPMGLTVQLSGSKAFRELFASNPFLAQLLLSAMKSELSATCGGPLPNLDKEAGRPRLELLERLGFPAERRAEKILRRVTPECWTVGFARELRKVMAHPFSLEILARARWVGPGARFLPVTKEGTLLLERKAWFSLAEAEEVDHFVGQKLLDLRIEDLPGEAPFRGISAFARWRERTWGWPRAGRQENGNMENIMEALPKGTFPPPPFPGSDTIRPLDCPRLVFNEGWINRICLQQPFTLKVFCESIMEGRSYLYAVYEPVRCTIEIARLNENPEASRWVVRQCCGPENDPVPARIRKALFRYLRGKRKDLPRLPIGVKNSLEEGPF